MKLAIILCAFAALAVVSTATPTKREVTVHDLTNATKEQLEKLLNVFEQRLEQAKQEGNFAGRMFFHMTVRLIKSLIHRAEQLEELTASGTQPEAESLRSMRESVEFIENTLLQAESRAAVDNIVNGIELVKLATFRTQQLVASIREVAKRMSAEGHPEVAEKLEKVADAMIEAKNKVSNLFGKMIPEERNKIIATIEGAFDVVDTALGIVEKIPFVKVKGVAETKAIVAALQSLTNAFKGEEVVEGDQKALEELLSVTGVPDVIKACRSIFAFISKVLKLAGQDESAVADYIKSTIKVIDATLDVYADAVNQAGDVAQKSWKDTAQQIKDKIKKLFRIK